MISTVMLLVFIPLFSAPSAGASDIRLDETVQFFPTLARQVDEGRAWELEIHGCIYKPEHRWVVSLLRGAFKDKIARARGDKACFKRCAAPFFYDYKGGREIRIQIG